MREIRCPMCQRVMTLENPSHLSNKPGYTIPVNMYIGCGGRTMLHTIYENVCKDCYDRLNEKQDSTTFY